METVYSIRDHPDVKPVVRDETCCLSGEGFWLLQSKANDEKTGHLINNALAKFFSKGKRHCFNDLRSDPAPFHCLPPHFLTTATLLCRVMLGDIILGIPDPGRFLSEHDLEPLPSSELRWEVPEPVVPPLPEPVTPQGQCLFCEGLHMAGLDSPGHESREGLH